MRVRKKTIRTTRRKGESWHYTNLDVLPDIDFEALETATNLKLSEKCRDLIELALAEYICRVRSYGNRPRSIIRKRALKSVEDACKVLETFLSWDGLGSLEAEEYAPVTMYLFKAATPNVNCYVEQHEESLLPVLVVEETSVTDEMEAMFNESSDSKSAKRVRFDGQNVADYLALCRKRARQKLDSVSFSGRPKNFAIERCIKALHEGFRMAGGKGLGALRTVDEVFTGPFLTFSKMLLDYTNEPLGHKESPFSESQLGALINNNRLLKHRLKGVF